MNTVRAPLPLVPSRFVMRAMPSILVDIHRLQKSKIWLCQSHTAIFGWANLIMTCWHSKPCASLPNDEELLKHYSKLGRKWNKVKAIIMEDFILAADNRYYHKYVAQVSLEIWIKSLISSIDSNLSNEKRWNTFLDNTELLEDLNEAICCLERLGCDVKIFKNKVLRINKRIEKAPKGDGRKNILTPNINENKLNKLNNTVNEKWEQD